MDGIAVIGRFTGVDEAVYATVGMLCRYFDLPGPKPALIERCCDKFVQRALVTEDDIPVPAFGLLANAPDVKRSAAGIPSSTNPGQPNAAAATSVGRDLGQVAPGTVAQTSDTFCD